MTHYPDEPENYNDYPEDEGNSIVVNIAGIIITIGIITYCVFKMIEISI